MEIEVRVYFDLVKRAYFKDDKNNIINMDTGKVMFCPELVLEFLCGYKISSLMVQLRRSSMNKAAKKLNP
jgi:hypothetical protein